MATGNVRVGQTDFGAGIYRGRESPDNAAYDLLNCLIDDEGQPFRRGGSAYYSTSNLAANLTGLADISTVAGFRTILWSGSGLYALNGSLAPVQIAFAAHPLQWSRVISMSGGIFVLAGDTPGDWILYGGSLKSADYFTGTVAVTNGSTTVTGTGTSWTANVDAGMLFVLDAQDVVGVVGTVTSNTSIQLASPWQGTTATGQTYTASPVVDTLLSAFTGAAITTPTSLASVGTVSRLLIGYGTKIYYTAPGLPITLDQNDFHELPQDARILGMDSWGDTAIIFTATGMWAISNMDFDPVDDVGNVQHRVDRLSQDVVLWGDSGIAGWSGALVVPAVDDVYLVTQEGAPTALSPGIRPLYRSYVKAGYRPGVATVHRAHYFLPIISMSGNTTTVQDVLVCRLDREFAWTRWSGHGAGPAYTQRIGEAPRAPKLHSAKDLRVTDLTDAFAPSATNASGADGTVHALDIITRDYSTPGGAKGATTKRVRVRYQATAAGTPTFTVSFARGPEDASFSSLSNLRGGGASDGLDESAWLVGKRAPAIRFRIQSSSALSTFTLREIEAHYLQRDDG